MRQQTVQKFAEVRISNANEISAICNGPSTIYPHSGTDDEGDMIFWDILINCNQDVDFYVDSYIENITLTVIGGRDVYGELWKDRMSALRLLCFDIHWSL